MPVWEFEVKFDRDPGEWNAKATKSVGTVISFSLLFIPFYFIRFNSPPLCRA